MGIDEAGKNDATADVDFFGVSGFGETLDFSPRADAEDFSVTDEDRAIFYDAQVRKGRAAARVRATERQ
jgi:hypothetical protein